MSKFHRNIVETLLLEKNNLDLDIGEHFHTYLKLYLQKDNELITFKRHWEEARKAHDRRTLIEAVLNALALDEVLPEQSISAHAAIVDAKFDTESFLQKIEKVHSLVDPAEKDKQLKEHLIPEAKRLLQYLLLSSNRNNIKAEGMQNDVAC